MKDFISNHLYRPTEAAIKKNSDEGEIRCECLSLFTNHHCIQCSLANKFCPLHGAFISYGTKDDKLPAEQERIVISFHPSQKTDRLLQPIKSIFMSNCNPEAKINFQYFSPKNLNTAMVRNKQIQTSSQALKTHFGGSCLVEKTKSYVANTTNKMKKLKQCFCSSCNSVEKSQSQVSVKKDKKVQNIFISSKNFMEKNDSQECRKSNGDVWFCYDNLVTSDTEKSGVSDSDVLTVNRNLKSKNPVHHKLFKINQSKNLVSFNKSKVDKTQLVFFSTVKNQNEKTQDIINVKDNEEYKEPESLDKRFSSWECIKKEKKEEPEKYGSEKFQSDSQTGSVYFTPFMLVPKDARKSDSDSESRLNSESSKANKEIQLDAKLENEERSLFLSTCSSPFFLINKNLFGKGADNFSVKQKPFHVEEENHTSPKLSSNNFNLTSTEMLKSEFKSLVAEIIKEKKSSDTKNEFTQYSSPSLSSVFHVLKKEGTETTSEEYHKCLHIRCNEKAMQTGNDFCKPSSSTKTSRSLTVCTCDSTSSNFTSDLKLFKGEKLEKENELCRVDSKLLKDFEVKAVELKKTEPQTEAILVSAASVQTLEIKLDECTQTEDDFQIPELIELNESEFSSLTYVKKSSLSQESNSDLKKFSRPLCQKFRSDSELYSKSKCECIKTENKIPPPLFRQEIGKEYIINSMGTSENSKALDIFFNSALKQKSTSEADNHGSIQSTDPKKTKKVDPKECGVNTSFSDLSELRKIINDNFDKMFEEALKVPGSCFDRGVQTDNSNVLLKIENIESKLLDTETQTSAYLIQLFESKATPVLMTKTNLVCVNCTKQVKLFADVGTCTEDSKKIDAQTFYELIQIKKVKNIEDTQQSKRFENCTTDKTIRKSFIKPFQSSTEIQVPVKKGYCQTQNPVPAPRKSIALKSECSKDSEGIKSRARQSRRLDNVLQSKMKPINNHRKSKTVNFNLSSQQSTSGTSEKSTMQTFQSNCICETVLTPVNPYVGKGNNPTVRGITKTETNTPKIKPKPKTRRITYPVVINSIWPQTLAEYLEKEDVSKDTALLAKCTTLSKRNLTADDFTETPTEKKKKNDTVDSVADVITKSHNCYVFGKTQSNKPALRKKSELVWLPSLSAPQFYTFEKDSINSCDKIFKSEEQIHHNTTTKSIPSVVDFRELFTVKSFEHTNMNQYVEEELFPKLYKCSFCKSLTYLKPKRFFNSNLLRRNHP